MIVRFSVLVAFFLSLAAYAGDVPCQGDDCPAQGPGQGQGPGQPVPVPPPAPSTGFCDGTYDGFLAAEPGPLSIDVRSVDDCGGIEVTGHWRGNTWVGRGICQQIGPDRASIVFQYPNTPVQRGFVTTLRDGGAELDGRVDGGDSFRLMRHGQ
jgi:hypothetical protein